MCIEDVRKEVTDSDAQASWWNFAFALAVTLDPDRRVDYEAFFRSAANVLPYEKINGSFHLKPDSTTDQKDDQTSTSTPSVSQSIELDFTSKATAFKQILLAYNLAEKANRSLLEAYAEFVPPSMYSTFEITNSEDIRALLSDFKARQKAASDIKAIIVDKYKLVKTDSDTISTPHSEAKVTKFSLLAIAGMSFLAAIVVTLLALLIIWVIKRRAKI